MNNKPDIFAPFDPDRDEDYARWRAQKLEDYPTSIEH